MKLTKQEKEAQKPVIPEPIELPLRQRIQASVAQTTDKNKGIQKADLDFVQNLGMRAMGGEKTKQMRTRGK